MKTSKRILSPKRLLQLRYKFQSGQLLSAKDIDDIITTVSRPFKSSLYTQNFKSALDYGKAKREVLSWQNETRKASKRRKHRQSKAQTFEGCDKGFARGHRFSHNRWTEIYRAYTERFDATYCTSYKKNTVGVLSDLQICISRKDHYKHEELMLTRMHQHLQAARGYNTARCELDWTFAMDIQCLQARLDLHLDRVRDYLKRIDKDCKSQYRKDS